MFTRLSMAGIAAALLLFVAAGARSASAQYPPPSGNCTLTVSTSQLNPGGNGIVTVTVRDVNGNPVQNALVTVNLVPPTNGASLSMDSANTNALGVVSGKLTAGGAGTVKISATLSGNACSATVLVGAGQVAAGVNLPNTGTGPAAGNTPYALVALLLVAGAAAVALGAGVRRISRG